MFSHATVQYSLRYDCFFRSLVLKMSDGASLLRWLGEKKKRQLDGGLEESRVGCHQSNRPALSTVLQPPPSTELVSPAFTVQYMGGGGGGGRRPYINEEEEEEKKKGIKHKFPFQLCSTWRRKRGFFLPVFRVSFSIWLAETRKGARRRGEGDK